MDENARTRRQFLVAAGGLGAGLIVVGSGSARAQDAGKGGEGKMDGGKRKDEPAEVTPTEDLMREHGVLDRVLLVYEEAIRRLDANEDLPPDAVAGGARLVKGFIEDYHERSEENYLFPRFEKAGKLVDLVKVLRAQHEAGRKVTAEIRRLATAAALQSPDDRRALSAALRSFVRMYRPHEAREDTVLFPALRSIVTAAEFDEIGEKFEEEEKKALGADGFEKAVEEVATLEKALGIYDLGQFTPKQGGAR